VAAADNSDYTLTAAGADYVEENAPDNEILTRLLKRGTARPEDDPVRTPSKTAQTERRPRRRFIMGPESERAN
jgi:hypothetical protein